MNSTFEMDSFTEKLLERNKKREEFLRQTQVKSFDEPNIDKENKKADTFSDKNITNQTVNSKLNDFQLTESGSCIIPKSGLKGLAALRSRNDSNFDLTSNVNTSLVKNKRDDDDESSFHINSVIDESVIKSPKGIKTRLARLAQSYTQQEDDYRSPVFNVNMQPSKKAKKLSTPTFTNLNLPYRAIPSSTNLTSNISEAKVGDKSMINLLEKYGLQSSDSDEKITPQLNQQKETKENEANQSKNTENLEEKKEPIKTLIDTKYTDKTAKLSAIKSPTVPFRSQPLSTKVNCESFSQVIEDVDPSCLPLSARRDLFEKKMSLKSHQPKTLPLIRKVKLFESNDDFSNSSQEPEPKKTKVEEPESNKNFSLIDEQTSFKKTEVKFEFPVSGLELDSQTALLQTPLINETNKNNVSQIKLIDSDDNDMKEEVPPISLTKTEEQDLGSIYISDEIESPQCSSTRLYPELLSFDETLDCVSKNLKFKTNMEVLSPIKETVIEESNSKPTTPFRTLSMYRREQKLLACQEEKIVKIDHSNFEQKSHKRKKIENEPKFSKDLKKKMKDLQLEAEKYNKIIDQSLRALALCICTENFSERLEAEKILLINMKKREAIVNHIYSLKDEKNFSQEDEILGCLSINNIQIALRGDFLVAQFDNFDLKEHHFICVFTCGDQVMSTPSVSSYQVLSEAILTFPVRLFFDQLSSSFEIKMEIFCLPLPKTKVAQKKRILLTPKFMSKHKTHLSPAPKKQSVVSNFELLGYYKLNRNNCSLRSHTLNDYDKNTALQGSFTLEMTLGAKYNVNYKCYLNFKEQSGEFWIWNRKWCVLDGYLLYFWRYYEDEDSKPPLGVINFKECVNFKILKASSNISMRENCFSFVTVSKKDAKSIKCHLLAADLKSELDEWLEKLNNVLEHVRIWELDAPTPWDQDRLDKWMK